MFTSSLAAIKRARMNPRGNAVRPGADRIVDKMPASFACVGLIHLALPNVRIIHACRDPIDARMSGLGLPFADERPYSYDLAEFGRHYL
jgi:hypothetical protein